MEPIFHLAKSNTAFITSVSVGVQNIKCPLSTPFQNVEAPFFSNHWRRRERG